VTSATGESLGWTLPKALLSHFSEYFKRVSESGQFTSNRVELQDFEPETFKLFVEYIHYGRYTIKNDDLSDGTRIRPDAKAWVLGDYLQATDFKNFAMNNLHKIYMPEERYPKAAVGPEMVLFCHCESSEGSALSRLIQAFLVQNWHNPRLVRFEELNAWDCVWSEVPALAPLLLFYLCRPTKNQYKFGSYISNYIEDTGDGASRR
jgi:hypothetical protein